MKKTTVSIIIPAKNEAKYIGLTLSALSAAIESCNLCCDVTVVDNGSTDTTVKIARSFGCEVIVDTRASVARLRNLGALTSAGDVLAFLDADCVVDRSWLASCVAGVQDAAIGIVGTCAVPNLDDVTWVEEGWYKLFSSVKRPDYPTWIGSSNMVIRRNVFLEVGGFDEDLETAEDVNFCNKIRMKYLVHLNKSINTIHLRESKTVCEFVKREFWRGKSSIRQFIISNSRYNEFLSIAVPFAYIVMFICTVLFTMADNMLWTVSMALIIMMPIAMMIKKKANIITVNDVCKVYLVATYYIVSRSMAMIYEVVLLTRKLINTNIPYLRH